MHDHSHHTDIIDGLRKQLEPVLESSEQGIYAYFDDNHKLCNDAFAKMLGYASAEEWEAVKGSFPQLFVEEGSRDALIDAYQDAMEKMVASTVSISWTKKGGGSVASTMILVPTAFEDHVLALHYISAK